MTRGVLWMTWGSGYERALARSRASVAHWHPELPQHVAEMPAGSNLLCKSRMYDLSPFDETLFLDADTTVLGRLDYGFDCAVRYGIALTISANPWQRRYPGVRLGHADEVEYSSGVLFFDKHWRASEYTSVATVFRRWDGFGGGVVNSATTYEAEDGTVREQRYNDQALLTLAMRGAAFNPFVLPVNWNLVPRWQRQFFGPVKIHHGPEPVPASLLRWNEEQSRPGAVIRCAQLPPLQ